MSLDIRVVKMDRLDTSYRLAGNSGKLLSARLARKEWSLTIRILLIAAVLLASVLSVGCEDGVQVTTAINADGITLWYGGGWLCVPVQITPNSTPSADLRILPNLVTVDGYAFLTCAGTTGGELEWVKGEAPRGKTMSFCIRPADTDASDVYSQLLSDYQQKDFAKLKADCSRLLRVKIERS